MRTLLILIIFIQSGELFSQLSAISPLYGTWANIEILGSLKQDSIHSTMDGISPQFIYVDSSNRVIIEYRFEQASAAKYLKVLVKRSDSIVLVTPGIKYLYKHDTLRISGNWNGYFVKVSRFTPVGSGMQIVLNNFFLKGRTKWNLVTFEKGKQVDTQIVHFHGGILKSASDGRYICEIEFTNDKGQFIMIFSKTVGNMTRDVHYYSVEKIKDELYLYKGKSLCKRLSPN
jgi:hypothetical protein